jgi:phasin family protein
MLRRSKNLFGVLRAFRARYRERMMVDPKNPFLDMDFKKFMGDFKMPGVDMDAVMAAQKRNIDALNAANQLAVESMQAVSKRQMEIFQKTMEEAQSSLKDLMGAGAPEDRVAKQTELMKAAFETAISNAREVSEMMTKSQVEAADVLNKRFVESLDEMKKLMAAKGK